MSRCQCCRKPTDGYKFCYICKEKRRKSRAFVRNSYSSFEEKVKNTFEYYGVPFVQQAEFPYQGKYYYFDFLVHKVLIECDGTKHPIKNDGIKNEIAQLKGFKLLRLKGYPTDEEIIQQLQEALQ